MCFSIDSIILSKDYTIYGFSDCMGCLHRAYGNCRLYYPLFTRPAYVEYYYFDEKGQTAMLIMPKQLQLKYDHTAGDNQSTLVK